MTDSVSTVGSISDLAAATDGISANDLLDLAYPVGSFVTINIGNAWAVSGSTMPEIGAGGGSFLGFDASTTETCAFGLGEHVPITWRTVDIYLETFNLSGDPGSNTGVVWQINVNSGGNATTTQTVTSALKQTVFKVGGQTYTLEANTIAGVSKYGATVVLSRLGGNGSDTYASDMYLSSLHAVRIT